MRSTFSIFTRFTALACGGGNGFAEYHETEETICGRISENSGRLLANRRKSHDFRYEPVPVSGMQNSAGCAGR
jgi:hypothetical protein